MKLLLSVCFAALVIVSCRKEPSRASGTGSLVYESDSYVDVMTNFEAVVNRCSLIVENADPYRHIFGQVLENASKTKMDGNGTAISDIQITNIRITSLELYSGFDIDTFDDYLENAEVILQYLDPSANWVSISLGTLSGVNTGQYKVLFNPSSVDLTSFMKNNPDKLFFSLAFNGVPPSELNVKYRVGFDYSYAYDEKEVK